MFTSRISSFYPLYTHRSILFARRFMSTAIALNPSEFVDFKLKNIESLTHNTSRFTFELPEHQSLGLHVASCILTKFIGPDGKPVIRPYTPTSETYVKGSWDLIIKRYDTGIMSSHIHNLKVGDTLSVKGPISKYPLKVNQHKSIALIAGGSGLTPILQLIYSILHDKEDVTKINFIFANVTPDDIILKDVLDELVKTHPDQLKVTYVVSRPPAEGWIGETGRVNAEMIRRHVPEIGTEGNKVFVCGPPGMMNAISGPKNPDLTQGELIGALKDLGLTSEQVFKF
ncbi:NADH-cytochrome b5 reductase 2 [Lobosporangium transversale]|uniref:NADH-cytochrome b5 reductase n=1 Tax=Lobosporangium transversale TaxID=64571 RepID=A0A1Y2GZ84_9FUNG|nr:NADH-cytochrome b5 reductase 2 [Lobosporangium transversale]ORZ27618.1 NADH-cytochrome b5 reductase 2 [Lobosporangium transversale]|eukprot:XP_021885321.1 NADH-cytochrome b5 reductase 2 [Lobosporangium transversale]